MPRTRDPRHRPRRPSAQDAGGEADEQPDGRRQVEPTSLYRGNRLERLFRDGLAAAQHGLLAVTHLEPAGRIRHGQDAGTPIF